jgi:hypothetical protein
VVVVSGVVLEQVQQNADERTVLALLVIFFFCTAGAVGPSISPVIAGIPDRPRLSSILPTISKRAPPVTVKCTVPL